MQKIYILLPVYNRREITKQFIRCLKSQTFPDYHLVLIDDGSTDGTEEMVANEIQSLTVLKGQGNWWWAGALQKGYQWLRSNVKDPDQIVLIANDDTIFEKDYLETGVRVLNECRNSLLVSICYSQETGLFLDAGTRIDWQNLKFYVTTKNDEINCLSTRGLFLRVGDFKRIGGFYPELIPHFLSDYEFTTRAYRKGLKLITDTSLSLRLNERMTWNTSDRQDVILPFWQKYFSKKSTDNIVSWSFFIVFSCPGRWKVYHLLRLWMNLVLSPFKDRCNNLNKSI